MSLEQTTITKLRELSVYLQEEINKLQILERPLLPDEKIRLGSLLEYDIAIDQTIAHLEPTSVLTNQEFLDGRYEGGNLEIYIKLRVDEKVSGVISADIYRNSITGRDYVASIRTTPGVAIKRNELAWTIIASSLQDQQSTGRLTLEPQNEEGKTLTGTLFLDQLIDGLPVRNAVHFMADHVSARPRELDLEVEIEEGIEAFPSYNSGDKEVDVISSLEEAGFDVNFVGESTNIPTPSTLWGTTELHALMVDLANTQLTRPEWKLNLLFLGKSSLNGLLGVMFDTTEILPRQGAAVFVKEIEDLTEASHYPRKLIQTTVHELGHALNLAHRFEREVGRADSTSFMNYDWRYKGGNKRTEYWNKFEFTFDKDELEFLRHAPRQMVIPGGAAFHSVNYWADGNGGYSPYVPEVPINFLELTLITPENQAIFDFAQPVFLEVQLKNLHTEPLGITPDVLDPKAGLLEILIRRKDSHLSFEHFIPIMERCYDFSSQQAFNIEPNETFSNNLNLTFGSAGFPFAEPGAYEVKVILAFYDRANNRDLIVVSNTLSIRVRYPQSRVEEDEAQILLRDDVGLYFALGGSQVLEGTKSDLEEIKNRRETETGSEDDPIIANIIRCKGIDSNRSYQRYGNGKFSESSANPEEAAELLKKLTYDILKKYFDPHTAKNTQSLAERLDSESQL